MFFNRNDWKTDDKSKKQQAMKCVGKMRNKKLLADVILTAPLWHTRMCAIHTLRTVSKGRLGLDEAEAMRSLMGLDIGFGDMYDADMKAYMWYEDELLNCLPDQHRRVQAALKAASGSVRNRALSRITDEECLMEIIRSPEAEESIREKAVSKIGGNESLLREVAENGALPEKVRAAAENCLALLEKLARHEAERQALKEKQAKCAITGHRMQLVDYIPRGNGGRDALYRCELCGAEEKWPYD